MTDLLEIKEKIKNIYGKFDIYIVPLFKFVLALCVFSIINDLKPGEKRCGVLFKRRTGRTVFQKNWESVE